MSLQGHINAEVMNLTSQQEFQHNPRFVFVGSLARAALLGYDIAHLDDATRRRFTDVDAIDRSTVMQSKYCIYDGFLDTKPTQSIRPVESGSTTWGLFDPYSDPEEDPLVTYSESVMELRPIAFSALYPEGRITTPSPAAIVALSDVYKYAANMPKHRDQLRMLFEVGGYADPALIEALKEYTERIKKRHTSSVYSQSRRLVFNAAPSLALAIQESALGKRIRLTRKTNARSFQTIDWALPSEQSTSTTE